MNEPSAQEVDEHIKKIQSALLEMEDSKIRPYLHRLALIAHDMIVELDLQPANPQLRYMTEGAMCGFLATQLDKRHDD
jgi:hypothetical protein